MLLRPNATVDPANKTEDPDYQETALGQPTHISRQLEEKRCNDTHDTLKTPQRSTPRHRQQIGERSLKTLWTPSRHTTTHPRRSKMHGEPIHTKQKQSTIKN